MHFCPYSPGISISLHWLVLLEITVHNLVLNASKDVLKEAKKEYFFKGNDNLYSHLVKSTQHKVGRE